MERRDSSTEPDLTVRRSDSRRSGPDGGVSANASRPARASAPSEPLPGELVRADAAPFVGRAAELRELERRWRLAQREARLVVLAGEPGIGKSRLAARFAVGLHATGSPVFYGRADEESVAPFQPFVEALRPYAARHPGVAEAAGLTAGAAQELARLVPELGPAAAAAVVPHPEERDRRRHQLFDGAVRLFLHAAATQPLLLVLEDLHWADVPTLLLLRQLLRSCAGAPLLVLATYSELDAQSESPRVLADLKREAPVDTIRVAGLDPREAGALVAALGGHEPLDAGRLRDQTGGNPFFIGELLHESGSAGLGAADGVPPGVEDLIGRRLDRLPPAALETLTLAAVLGCDFRLTTLQAVATDRDQDELLAELEAAVRAGLLVEHPDEVDRFAFAHTLMRETLYDRPIAARRLRLHRRVAEALENAPVPMHPAEIAHHYFQSRSVGGAAKAIVFNLRAGEVAQASHAYEEAAQNYERALTALDLVFSDDDAARCDILLALGSARWQASEPAARTTFLQALERAREVGSWDRFARAVLGAGGRFYAPVAADLEYAALLEEALAALEPGDSALRVRVLARLAENLVFAEPPERADVLASEAIDMARRLGEPHALAAALSGRHAALLHAQYARERRRIAEQTIALAGELGSSERAALERHWLLYDLAELGDLSEATRRHGELERLAAELQQPLYHHSALAWRCVWSGLAGRFEEAERLASDAVRLAADAADPDAKVHHTAQLVAVRREQGRLGELLADIRELAHDGPEAVVWRSVLPLAELDAGHPERARAAYEQALSGGVAGLPRNMYWLTAAAALAEAAAALGDAHGAGELHGVLEPFANRFVQWSFTGNAGSVHRLLGRTAAAAGRPEAATAHFEAALARHAALDAAPLLARTRCDYGEFLLASDRTRAEDLLREAETAAERLGMAGVAARARSAR
jgi:hypothetical protein